MKRAVSISIGSSKRDKRVEANLLDEKVSIERIGTNGDMEKAAQLFAELDGKVDAFGVGGTNLGLMVDGRWYPLYSVQSLTRFVKKTPVVDGCGLKATLETFAMPALEKQAGAYLDKIGRRAFVVTAVDRWGMVEACAKAGCKSLYGDLMFSLGIPLPLYKVSSVKMLAAILMPVVSRLPFSWVYPIGEAQEKRTPKWHKYFEWSSIICGDCHYITRYMPERLEGKVIITNTTTTEDVALFRSAGVKYLMTTTPVLDGRSFGTNMMEAALIAASGRTQPVDYANPGNYFGEIADLLTRVGFEPVLQELS